MLIIYCDDAAMLLPENIVGVIYTKSFLTCLSLAEIHCPDFIFLHFSYGSVQKNEKLFELCGCLKKDIKTKKIPIIAILSYPNRHLITEINKAGIEFISCFSEDHINPEDLVSLIIEKSDLKKSDNFYEAICPFLDYKLYDVDQEIILCGALEDKKVINSHLLKGICCNKKYQTCGLYLNPRVKHEFYKLKT